MSRKSKCLLISLFLVVGWVVFLANEQSERIEGTDAKGLIRLHIIANSDSEQDQNIKFKVRDAVIAYLTPLLDKKDSPAAARQVVAENRDEIVQIANRVLNQNSVLYTATMEMGMFDFPIKSYGTLVLPAGKYEAVRILLGESQGKNWWCVLFPPLCLVDGTTAIAVTPNDKPLEVVREDGSEPVEFRWKLAELWSERQKNENFLQNSAGTE